MDTLLGMQTFCAVVECGSFAAAGERLGIPGKLVKSRMVALERRWGSVLLLRNSGEVSPTVQGRHYLDSCRHMFAEMDKLDAALCSTGETNTTIRISAPIALGAAIVTPAIMSFMEAHPELAVNVHFTDRQADPDSGDYDFSIRVGGAQQSRLRQHKLGDTQLLVVASAEYISRHGIPELPTDLDTHTCILNSDTADPRHWQFQIEGIPIDFSVSGKFMTNNNRAGLAMARAGKGVYICPDILLADDLESGRLIRLLSDYPSRTLGIRLLRPASSPECPQNTDLLDALRDKLVLRQRKLESALTRKDMKLSWTDNRSMPTSLQF